MSQFGDQLPQNVLHPYTGVHIAIRHGYIYELCPNHPLADKKGGFVLQHRLVVERAHGAYLDKSLHVHHIDGNKANNDLSNLKIVTRKEHMALHMMEKRIRNHGEDLNAGIVEQALRQGGLKAAARALGCSTDTIRNRYPDLVEPYKRRSPTQIDDPVAISKILAVAPNDKKSYQAVAKETGISYRTIQRICERNGIPWTRKTRKGEIHKTYQRKISTPWA